MFRFSTNEVIVGRAASRQFVGLNVGDTVVSGQNRWVVVGIFEADGGVAETEIWCDVHTLQDVYRRINAFNLVSVKLDTTDSFETFSQWLTANPQVHVNVYRENEYYQSRSQTMTRLIDTLGFGIASLMGIGAVFGAILTMYTAVASRAREIRNAARAWIQHGVGSRVGARRICHHRRHWRAYRRSGSLSRFQRLSDLDHELSDVQPGGLRISRHAPAARDRLVLRAVHRSYRRTLPGNSRRPAANSIGIEGAVVLGRGESITAWRSVDR